LTTARICLVEREYENSYEAATNAIKILEDPNSELGPFKKNKQAMAYLYALAATSADQLRNEQIAYEFSKKAFDLYKDEETSSMLAVTSYNLSLELSKKGDFSGALKLARICLPIYEEFPDWTKKNMPSNTAEVWYHDNAVLDGILGFFKESQTNAFKAVRLNPSTNNIELLGSALTGQGYFVDILFNTNSHKIFLFKPMTTTNVYELNTNNEIINFNGKFL
jgi:tetratricopeptide (TPR) repeat protein